MNAKNTKYALLLAYRGGDFHGFQAQGELKTVERSLRLTLEQALHIVPRQLVPAGRTDAGVHAIGQVLSLRLRSEARRLATPVPPVQDWPRLFNARAPRGIWMRGALVVSPAFHARARALLRSYRYILREDCAAQAPHCDPNWAWALTDPLELARMLRAAADLICEHDFTAFGYRLDARKSARCAIHKVQIERRGRCVVVDIEASRFLRRMVRLMVAQLVEVGLGLQAAESVRLALTTGQSSLQGAMAPARGLYLRRVRYALDDLLPASASLRVPRRKPALSADSASSNSATLDAICASMRRS